MAAKHEAFSRTEEANGIQFSLSAFTMEVLPSNNLKIGSKCQSCTYQVGYSVLFPVARKLRCMAAENGFKQVENRLVSSGKVLK